MSGRRAAAGPRGASPRLAARPSPAPLAVLALWYRRARLAAAVRGRLFFAVLALAILPCAVVTLAPEAGAQGGAQSAPEGTAPAEASGPPDTVLRRVAGRVVRPTADGVAGVRGAWVTLHRVGSDRAGPLDSVRTDATGRFAFRYRHSGSEDAIYFVSASYGGIAYFTPPLRGRDVAGDDADVTVFDTTSGPITLGVRGRHVIVSAEDSTDRRTVIEVYELSNDSSRTLVGGSPPGDQPTWTATLPAGAQNFRVGQGDVSPEAVSLERGRALVYAPFAPGLKQLSYSYTLPQARFPLSLPVLRETTVLEVLVEEPAARAAAPKLSEVNPVSVDGRNFKRFLGQDVPANAVLTVTVPENAPRVGRSTLIAALLGVIGAAMLLALARAVARRPRVLAGAPVAPVAPRSPEEPSAERLARDIADLDAAFEREPSPSDEARAAYERRRGELKALLTDALARRADAG